MPENFGAYLAVAITILWFVGTILWFLQRQFGRTKTVKATLVNKQVTEDFSKYAASGKSYHYYVTFLINDKRRSFKVSEFSYNGYHKGESGTLKYKGDRLIDFS